MYKKVDVTNFEGIDEPEDVNGYMGQTKYYRSIKKETAISEQEFLEIIREQPRITFDSVMGTINEIDKDHNGYVTKTEIEDILKIKYPEHFETRDLIPIIKKFSSIQNKILIDYKGFRDWVRLEMKTERAKSVTGKRPSVEMKQIVRPNTSIGNSRTQSRLRNATAQDQVMNNVVSVTEFVKENEN